VADQTERQTRLLQLAAVTALTAAENPEESTGRKTETGTQAHNLPVLSIIVKTDESWFASASLANP